jgi:hypothetical protein
MATERERTPADLSAEIMSADRPSQVMGEEAAPIVSAMDPVGLALYPWLRRHRRTLLPLILVAMGVLIVVALIA